MVPFSTVNWFPFRLTKTDVWQITNEIAQTDPAQIAKLADFSIEYIRLLANGNMRAAIGGFSVGRPEAPRNDRMAAWGAFLPAMREGMRHDAVLLLHAYGRPHIFGDPQTHDSPPEWFLQRYEYVVRPDLPPDVRDMPYVYGEYGCDMRGGSGGWKTGYKEDYAAYAKDLHKAAELLAQQPNCLGACVYTLGSDGGWGDFDIAGPAADALAAMAWPAPQRIQPAPPPPAVPVQEVVVTPSVQPAPPLVSSPAARRAGERIGIDANNPLAGQQPAPQVADPAIIADAGAGWVRLNFVAGGWGSVEEAGWEQAFRQIISGFRSRGLKIYGLISHEALRPADFGDVLRQPPPEFTRGQEWVDRYVDTFASIVRRFHGDVAAWESFNEPDDWHGAKGDWPYRNWMHPGWFAIMLERIYNKVKFEPGLEQVRLVSGPVQGLPDNQNAGAEYLRKTYQEGKKRFGWGKFGKPFPFDGVGYHLYIEEGAKPWAEQAQRVPAQYGEYLQGMKNVIKEHEGAAKPLFISEAGWTSNGDQDEFQSRNLGLGLELLLKDPWVELAVWFCTQDFEEPRNPPEQHVLKYYGVYRRGGLGVYDRKPAFVTMQAFCAREWTGLPASAALPTPALPAEPAAAPAGPQPVYQLHYAPMPATATNQQVINAFKQASLKLGMGNWGLMTKAGLLLSQLAKDQEVRNSLYTGSRLDDLTRLTVDERSTIRQALPDDVSFDIFAPAAFLCQRLALVQAALAWPEELHIVPGDGATPARRRVAAVWNRFGFLLIQIADALGIAPALAVAVIAEARGRQGLDSQGRLVLRFEVGAFYERWGRDHADAFARHFSLDPARPAQNHMMRQTPESAWQEVHRSYDSQWTALRLAAALDRDAALAATALGFPRLIGSDHAAAGYASAQAMFDAFASSERFQVLACFDLIAGPTADSRRLEALCAGDLETFAALHYGPQNAARYATILRDFAAVYTELDPLA
ncbi:MAG: N-acetylmuramidase domain-containing protein [Chloroflexi bacterium]|nr:N-acetylmuramidase domain-containing protein [Chloroflexota bacterium]